MVSYNNRLITGMIVGLFAPLISFVIFVLLVYPDDGIMHILTGYIKGNVLTHVMSLAILINLPIFFVFLETKKERSARGVIGSTLLYGLVIVILKFT